MKRIIITLAILALPFNSFAHEPAPTMEEDMCATARCLTWMLDGMVLAGADSTKEEEMKVMWLVAKDATIACEKYQERKAESAKKESK